MTSHTRTSVATSDYSSALNYILREPNLIYGTVGHAQTCPRDYGEATAWGLHLLTHPLIAIHLSSYAALHYRLSRLCSTPSLFITDYKRHRNLQQALIAVFSSTYIQRNQSSELLLPHLPVCIARHETPSSTYSDVQYQIRTNSVCRDTYPSRLIAQRIAILTGDTYQGTHHHHLCSA